MKNKIFLLMAIGLLGLGGCQSAQPVTENTSSTHNKLEERENTNLSHDGQTPVTFSRKKTTSLEETDDSLGNKGKLGAPYETEMDSRSEAALSYVRTKEPELGPVSRYRKQIVNGTNYYFDFFQSGALAFEIVVYEDSDGNLEITSKKSLK